MPKVGSILRYTGPEGSNASASAIILKDNRILEVKRNGVAGKKFYNTYAEWLVATLPLGTAGNVTVTEPVSKTRAYRMPRPTTDMEWLDRAFGSMPTYYSHGSLVNKYYENLNQYNRYKASCGTGVVYNYLAIVMNRAQQEAIKLKNMIDSLGGMESEKANEVDMSMKGKKPQFYILGDTEKPEAVWFGRAYFYDQRRSNYSWSTPTIVYRGKEGTSFAEVGIPVDPVTQWPNLWKIWKGEFKKIERPVVKETAA
jgi:hypothetical protein